MLDKNDDSSSAGIIAVVGLRSASGQPPVALLQTMPVQPASAGNRRSRRTYAVSGFWRVCGAHEETGVCASRRSGQPTGHDGRAQTIVDLVSCVCACVRTAVGNDYVPVVEYARQSTIREKTENSYFETRQREGETDKRTATRCETNPLQIIIIFYVLRVGRMHTHAVPVTVQGNRATTKGEQVRNAFVRGRGGTVDRPKRTQRTRSVGRRK